jgi:GNAT superfamily N-acetyltransferase
MIRAVQDSDIPELLELCAEHARYEKADVVMDGKSEALKNAFATHKLYGWVVERDKELVGYATATLDYSTWYAAEFLHMDCLYLKENVRGEGLGKMLVAEMLKLAKEKNCINVQWQTPDWNTRAMNFYSRLGASSKPKIRFYLEQV